MYNLCILIHMVIVSVFFPDGPEISEKLAVCEEAQQEEQI